MRRQIVVRVETATEFDCGPDYALIEVEEDAAPELRRRLADTVALAEQYRPDGGVPIRIGGFPVTVTWLHYEGLLDGEGDEPEWLGRLTGAVDDGYAVVEGFEPDPDGVYTAVETETVHLRPDGNMRVEGMVDSTGIIFRTVEVPIGVMLGEG